jgi:hypothetical protein
MKRKATNEEIINAAHTSASMYEAARKVGLNPTSFIIRAKKLGVYNPNPNPNPKGKTQISKARQKYFNETITPLDDILQGMYPNYKGLYLKHRLYEAKLKKEKCEECGQKNSWNGKPLTLELEHVNGNKKDHRLNNLRILCLHCHSQTPTFRRRKSSLCK